MVRFLPWLVSLLADGLNSVVLPVEGIAKARDTSMYFRNDEQLLGLHTEFTELTGDDQFFRSVIFTCDTFQHGQKSQNVETLNWSIDPREFEQVRRGMDPFPEANGAATDGPRPSRNSLRVKSLLRWWSGRGGKLRHGMKSGQENLSTPSRPDVRSTDTSGRSSLSGCAGLYDL